MEGIQQKVARKEVYHRWSNGRTCATNMPKASYLSRCGRGTVTWSSGMFGIMRLNTTLYTVYRLLLQELFVELVGVACLWSLQPLWLFGENEMNPGILRCGVNPSRMQSLKWVISSLTRTKNSKQEDINGRFIQKLNMKYITCKCFSYSNLRFFNLIVDDKRPSPAWPRTDPSCWSVKVITGVPTVID